VCSCDLKDKQLIICDSVDSLVWFANHGSIEYHIPFQYVNNDHPVEIAFDLDPPDRSAFHLAIQAARLIKQILDDLDVISFVKTSGNKGLKIQIQLEKGMMRYEETSNLDRKSTRLNSSHVSISYAV